MGIPMRRKEKEIRSKQEMEDILRKSRICRLAFSDDGEPYIVPVCFGYRDDRIYFHSAPDGRKMDIIRKNPRVCFEVESDVQMKEAEEACGWSVGYRCVVGLGKAVLLHDPDEKADALKVLMAQYTEKEFSFENKDLSDVACIRIDIEWMTGKYSV